jgi:O-antigen/teichoic acid export membrane protein
MRIIILSEQFALKKNMIWNSIGTSVYTICQALTTILVVRLTNFTVAGNLSLAIAVTAIFGNLAHYNIRNYQVSDLLPKYKSSVYISTRILTCGVSFILCFVFILFNSYSLEQDVCILLYMIFRIGEIIIDTYYGIDQVAGRMDILSKSFIVRGVLILCTFVFGLLFTKSLNISVLFMGISTFVVAIIYDIPQSKHFDSVKPVFEFNQSMALLKECLPLAINMVIAGCIISIPRFYLQSDYSNEALGIYTSVASPILIVQVLSSYLLTPLLTALSQNIISNNIKQFISLTIKCALAFIGIAIAAVLGTVLVGKFALYVLFGKVILPYYYLLLPAICYALLQLGSNLISTIFIVLRKLILLTISNFILLLSCVILAPFLIKNYQMQGVNITLIVSTLLQIAFLIIVMIIILKKYFNNKKIKNNDL